MHILDMCLKSNVREREKKTQGDLPSADSLPNGCYSQMWARLKLGTMNQEPGIPSGPPM